MVCSGVLKPCVFQVNVNKNRKSSFICQDCGYNSVKWLGRCPDCGGWNTFQEEIIKQEKCLSPSTLQDLVPITQLRSGEEQRTSTGISEFDRVLGGGAVSGSLIVVGGEPGIGKSTLLLQMSNLMRDKREPILYVSGEESQEQIHLRAVRTGLLSPNLYVLPETDLNTINAYIEKLSPGILIVDSIQTISNTDLTSPPGSVSQLRDCAYNLMRIAKKTGLIIFLIGHVTKEGIIAGPKLLEHMVDTVLYFEGNSQYTYRILRSVKNRFGSTNEVGIFEMTSKGLMEVTNPSAVFLSEGTTNLPGTVIFSAIEGTRPLLIEIQALTTYSSYAQPRRSANGIELNRLFLVLAVLEKRLGLNFGNRDVYVNVVGGVKIDEPAVDLAIASSICSSFWDKALPKKSVVFGEIGLTGEVRAVSHTDKRLMEISKMAFERCILPEQSKEPDFDYKNSSLELSGVNSVEEALYILLGVRRLEKD